MLASILLEEIGAEERWGERFDGSRNLLEQLAAEAIRAHDSGRARPLEELE